MGIPNADDLTKQAEQKEEEARRLRSQANQLSILESLEKDGNNVIDAGRRILDEVAKLRDSLFGKPAETQTPAPVYKDEKEYSIRTPAPEQSQQSDKSNTVGVPEPDKTPVKDDKPVGHSVSLLVDDKVFFSGRIHANLT